MRTLFPAFLDLRGRPVLLVGGGTVATQKLRPLLDAGAAVTVVSPDVSAAIVDTGVTVRRRPFAPRDLDGCWYVVAAAPPAVNAWVQREGEARRVFVNAVDDPEHASAFAGSVVRRGPVTVAISTGGQAPALARLMREALERLLPESLTEWTSVASALRAEWRRHGVPMSERTSDLLSVLVELRGHEAAAAGAAAAPPRDVAPGTSKGSVAIVGAGPGDPGLLTRRAAALLAEADLVLYDALVGDGVLALASHARLVHVGRRIGRATATQEQIHDQLVEAVARGERAVRLKGGDPFLFGRGGEDAVALARRGIACEIVPGVSSALAGPALAGIPVTHRHLSSGVVVVTGHDIERFRALTRRLPCDLTLVVLMGMHQRAAIASHLLESGWNAATPAAIVRGASRQESTVWTGVLPDLAAETWDETGAPGLLVIGDVVSVRGELADALDGNAAVEIEVCHG